MPFGICFNCIVPFSLQMLFFRVTERGSQSQSVALGPFVPASNDTNKTAAQTNIGTAVFMPFYSKILCTVLIWRSHDKMICAAVVQQNPSIIQFSGFIGILNIPALKKRKKNIFAALLVVAVTRLRNLKHSEQTTICSNFKVLFQWK